jgi:hypothetical protein
LLALHRSSVSIDTVFRAKRHTSKPQNAADCHQFAATCPVLAARNRVRARHSAMRLKRFSQCRFSSRSDSAILILPQAMRRRLAKKTLLAERLFVLSQTP